MLLKVVLCLFLFAPAGVESCARREKSFRALYFVERGADRRNER